MKTKHLTLNRHKKHQSSHTLVKRRKSAFPTCFVTQVDRLKDEDCRGKAHFKVMFDARITFRQSTAIMFF